MTTKITIKSDETFDVAFLLGARAYYVEGAVEEYYPALDFMAVNLPDDVHFPRLFRLKGEPALPSKERAKARAREIVSTTICQSIANMVLADYAQEP